MPLVMPFVTMLPPGSTHAPAGPHPSEQQQVLEPRLPLSVKVLRLRSVAW
jgi:hypothetical protein